MAGRGMARRWRFIAAGVIALGALGGLGSGIYRALGACQPLDRWLGISGCRARIVVQDFTPRIRQSMAWPRGDDTISFFGMWTTDQPKQQMVRIAFPGGEERGRIPLPVSSIYKLRTSVDGAWALIDCHSICGGVSGYTALVSVSDGKISPWPEGSGRPYRSAFYLPFPGEEGAPLSDKDVYLTMGVGGALSPDRKYIAKLSEQTNDLMTEQGQVVLSARGDGSIIRSLDYQKRKGVNAEITKLEFSPSGKLIALLEQQPLGPPDDSIVHIWAVESGRRLASLRRDGYGYSDLLWSWDDKYIILNSGTHSGGRPAMVVDIFDWRKKALPAARTPGSV
jgi:WD40 repeat protein